MKIKSDFEKFRFYGAGSIQTKMPTVQSVIDGITAPIRKANNREKALLRQALRGSLKNCQPKFDPHGNDILGGEILSGISVTSKGISPMQMIGNVVNVELARIRGQLKRVPQDGLNL